MTKNHISRIFIFGIIPFLLACMFSNSTLSSQADPTPIINPANFIDLTGKYRVEGTNSSGGNYTGEVTLIRSGIEYQVLWIIGSTSYGGKGTLTQNTFKVVWTIGAGDSGTATYELQEDGSLVGTWEFNGNQGTEILTP